MTDFEQKVNDLERRIVNLEKSMWVQFALFIVFFAMILAVAK